MAHTSASDSEQPIQSPLELGSDGRLSRVGPYQVLRTVGWGGMGEVFAARDTRNEDSAAPEVALKVLRSMQAELPENVYRFHREISTLRTQSHPNIITIYDSGESDHQQWYAMELIHGSTLDDWARKPGRTLREKIKLMTQVCDALAHAHAHGVIHRDLKPGNIMVDGDNRPVVTDFGLAREMGAGPAVTQSDRALGTPGYMSPEQARGRHTECDGRTDVWALGSILYELLIGVPPFVAESPAAVLAAVCLEEPPAMRQINPSVPPMLERVVMHCLRKDQKHRYATVDILKDDLETWLANGVVAAPRYGVMQRWWPRIRHLVVPIVLSILIITGITISGLAWYQSYQYKWGRWIPVFERDFTDPEVSLEGLGFYGRELMRKRPWSRGERGLLMQELDWLMLDDVSLPSETRVVLTVWSPTPYDGINICVNADMPLNSAPTPLPWPVAHHGHFGRWNGLLDTTSNMSDSVSSLMKSGTVHEISFTRDADQLIQTIDGHENNTSQLMLPLTGGALDQVAIRTWDTDCELLSISVYRLAPARYASPLASADTMVRIGESHEAIDEYLTIAEAYGDNEIGTKAMAKALMVATAHLGVDHSRTLHIEQALTQRTAAFEERLAAEESYAVALWQERKYDRAYERMHHLLDKDPDSKIIARCLGEQIQDPIPRNQVDGLMALLRRSRGIAALQMSGQPIRDLSALAHLPLRMLFLARTKIQDLTPIAQSELKQLDISNTLITDIEPLRDLQLVRFDADKANIYDISVLQGHPLHHLSLIGNHDIDSLEGVRGAPLNHLDITGTKVSDLSPLASMPLRTLRASRSQVSDLGPLSDVSLQRLRIDSTAVSDLSPLQHAPLIRLHMEDTHIQSLAPILHTGVKRLYCSGSPIIDFSEFPDRPPETFRFPNAVMPAADWLAMADRLDQASRPRLAQDARILGALLAGDKDILQASAVAVDGKQLVWMPLPISNDEAVTMAKQVGASLAVLDNTTLIEAAKRVSWMQSGWVGAVRQPDVGSFWSNGVKVDETYLHPRERSESGWFHLTEGFLRVSSGSKVRRGAFMMWPPVE